MQLLLKVTENNDEIVELGGGLQMPPVKEFMDDTTILSSKDFYNLQDTEPDGQAVDLV